MRQETCNNWAEAGRKAIVATAIKGEPRREHGSNTDKEKARIQASAYSLLGFSNFVQMRRQTMQRFCRFADRLRQRRMRMNAKGDIAGGCTHFDGQHSFGD